MRRSTTAGIVLLTALALSACSGSSDTPAAEETEAETAAAAVSPIEGLECTPGSEPEGEPIVVGGSLSLTGNLGPTGKVHDVVGEIVADWVNDCGGIDGRPIEWRVLDDASTPAQAGSNYERLINDGVDLVIGPYGTANILAGAAPVGRAGYAYPTHSFGAPEQFVGDNHFPAWQFGNGDESAMFVPQAETLWGALEASGNPPATAFYATSKFPSTIAITDATRTLFEEEGVETVGDVQYDLGTTDFSSLALRIQQADPDFLYLGALGADIASQYEAFATIGYVPRAVYASLPAPGAVASLGGEAEGLMLLSIYEDNGPLAETDIAQRFSELFVPAAEEAGVFPGIETQAAASLGAWQILLTAVANVGVDNAAIIEYLKQNEVPMLAGTAGFDGFNGFTSDFNRVTQIQDGERVLVWPADVASGEPTL